MRRLPNHAVRFASSLAIVSVLPLHAARAQAVPATSALQLFWNPTRGDNYSTATAVGRQAATSAGYSAVRVEGCVLTAQDAGTVPLYQYWSALRGDNIATTSNLAEKGRTNPSGYSLVRVEGYVYEAERKGTVALKLFYNTERHDNFTTATAAGEQAALRAGYTLVSVLGYVNDASSCATP